MNVRDDGRRKRVVDALGIGPLWVRKTIAAFRNDEIDPAADKHQPAARLSRIGLLDWEPLREMVAQCVACDLCRSRTRTVFGAGARRPEWLIVGTAPDDADDAIGDPFVGPAGQLLDAMLASIGLSRTRDVFVVHALKCRPPVDREPSIDEIASCRPYLERQIALLAPRMILVLGDLAGVALLGPEAMAVGLPSTRRMVSIGGRDIPLVTVLHPAVLLDSGDRKADAWADLCLAREIYEGLDPATGG